MTQGATTLTHLPADAGREEAARIYDLDCNAPEGPVPGFEITALDAVRRRIPKAVLKRFNRVDFHTITLITEGQDDHTVDFVTYGCRPGTLLWVRPGQVQRFVPSTLQGVHLRFAASFPLRTSRTERLLTPWAGPVWRQLGMDAEYSALSASLGRLATEYAQPAEEVSREILQHLLAATLLEIDRLLDRGTGEAQRGSGVYTRFCAELETSYATVHRAEDYSRRLGYTVKTLTRACLAATGQPVKQVIDARIALQAQRLLAHTDDPVSSIARALGFSEPTNFSKFFTRLTGTAPGDFRHLHRGGDVR